MDTIAENHEHPQPPRRDYRDDTIEQLFDELEAAKALIVTLTEAADTYRLIANEAMARLHEHYEKQQRLEARLAALRDEIRRYTTAQIGSVERVAA